jgi:hypothetical protein
MKSALQKIALVATFAGSAVVVGTLYMHERIMDSPGWSGPHPDWISWLLLIGVGLIVVGLAASVVTGATRETGLAGRIALIIGIAVLFLAILPSVC